MQNFNDKELISKVDKNIFELLQVNIKKIMQTQLMAKQNEEIQNQFNFQQKLLDLQ